MLTYAYVAAGGAIGSVCRFVFSTLIARSLDEVFPFGTLVVNVTGCFLIGLLAALTGPKGGLTVAPDIRQFLMVGICGGYTTFSSFSLQTLTLVRDGDLVRAGLNVMTSVVFCLVAVGLGSAAGAAVGHAAGA